MTFRFPKYQCHTDFLIEEKPLNNVDTTNG